ncbi:MAG: hypothetical protein K2P12_02885 [Clostridia bacterium]|nr:hypothetical protein [Clostridia bacterium]
MKKVIDWLIIIFSVACSTFGILSLISVIGIADVVGFYKNFDHILLGYVIVVISMACGIMSFNIFAGRRKKFAKVVLSIGVTTYSTILTIPLFLTFVLCLIKKFGANFSGFINDFVAPIYDDLVSIFKQDWAQYLVFIGGIIMGIVFLAVPIIMCIQTLKPKKGKKLKKDEFELE